MAMVRNSKGQFVKGNKGGPGRKPKRLEEDFYAVASKVYAPEDIQDILTVLLKKAKSGNLEAMKLCLAYIFGTPIQRNEHTGKDGGALRIEIVDVDG